MTVRRTCPHHGGAGLSRAEVGQRLGISETRVGQIERRALAKMLDLAGPIPREELLEFFELGDRHAV